MEVMAKLMLAHQKMAGGFLPFDRFLNPEAKMEDILASGYGLLAMGPTVLMRAYGEVLDAEGIAWSSVEWGPPKRWVYLHVWIEPKPGYRVAVLGLDDSYVVARRLSATILDGAGGGSLRPNDQRP
jgi:hypothetical protein